MENSFRLSQKIIALVLLFLIFSCNQDETINSDLLTNDSQSLTAKISPDKINLFKGPRIMLGNDSIRSWISIKKETGMPVEIGIVIPPKAFEGLPENDDHGSTIIVPLHLKAKQLTPFDHIGLNWNPHGHVPIGIFDTPHFDIHFYTISVEEQMAIPAWSPSTDALFNNYPPSGYYPADYGTPPGPATAEPQMGKHWSPNNLPDYLPFSKIMIYGSYNGKVIFVEPMVTLDYFLSKPDFSASYSQPEKFEKAGNYPTKYNIYYDWATGNTYVTLSDFVWRTPPPSI